MSHRDPTREAQANLATFVALLGLLLIGGALLALMAMVLPQMLWIVVILALFIVPTCFHYLVWGWWMSQIKDDEADKESE